MPRKHTQTKGSSQIGCHFVSETLKMKAWTSAAAPPQWLEYDLGKARRGKIVLVPRWGIGQTSKLSARTARTTPPKKIKRRDYRYMYVMCNVFKYRDVYTYIDMIYDI